MRQRKQEEHELVKAQVATIFGLITPEALAAELGVTVKTLAQWRSQKRGPPWIKVEGKVMYPVEGVRQWLKGRMHAA